MVESQLFLLRDFEIHWRRHHVLKTGVDNWTAAIVDLDDAVEKVRFGVGLGDKLAPTKEAIEKLVTS